MSASYNVRPQVALNLFTKEMMFKSFEPSTRIGSTYSANNNSIDQDESNERVLLRPSESSVILFAEIRIYVHIIH